jgi:inner membrane protein
MFALTHLFGGWILGKLWEKSQKKRLSSLVWFVLLFGSVLPDIDLLSDLILKTVIHRTFTHSLLFVLLTSLIFYLVFSMMRNFKYKLSPLIMTLSLALGMLTHILLDIFTMPGVALLWPCPIFYSIFGTFQNIVPMVDFPISLKNDLVWFLLDMIIGTSWILWLSLRGGLNYDSGNLW